MHRYSYKESRITKIEYHQRKLINPITDPMEMKMNYQAKNSE